MTSDQLSRRRILAAAGVSIGTVLAGCSGGGSSTTSTGGANTTGGASTRASPSATGTTSGTTADQNGTENTSPAETQTVSSSGPLQSITYNKNNIAVTVKEGAEVNGFTLIAPDGSEVSQHILSGGETKGTLSISTSDGWVSAGTYTIHVIEGTENVVQEEPIELRPNVALTNVGLVSIDPSTEYDTKNPPPFYSTVQVAVENTGTLPARLTYAGLTKGVLQPNHPPGATGSDGNLGTGEVVSPKSTHQFEVPQSPLRYTGMPSGQDTPGAQQTVVEDADWEEGKKAWCNGKTSTAKLLIEGQNIESITAQASLKFAGTATRRQAMELDVGCTNVSVVDEWTQNGSSLPGTPSNPGGPTINGTTSGGNGSTNTAVSGTSKSQTTTSESTPTASDTPTSTVSPTVQGTPQPQSIRLQINTDDETTYTFQARSITPRDSVEDSEISRSVSQIDTDPPRYRANGSGSQGDEDTWQFVPPLTSFQTDQPGQYKVWIDGEEVDAEALMDRAVTASS